MNDHKSKNNHSGAARWALAIHGGAGTIDTTASEAQKQGYLAALSHALSVGQEILRDGGTSLDAVEHTVRALENDPHFNAGKGSAYTHVGTCELDAAIMDGRDHASGAVAAVRNVRNPISLCRRIMEDGKYVMIAGEGAKKYARAAGLEIVDDEYFQTQERHDQWQRALKQISQGSEMGAVQKGTVGAVALDTQGNLAAATSTGGLTDKLPGRVGDSPVIGAGTYADNATCAVSCTGNGEEFIRESVAFRISALMQYSGKNLTAAADEVVFEGLTPNCGGIIAVGRDGEITLPFNTPGMYRGAADSNGRFQVAIWDW